MGLRLESQQNKIEIIKQNVETDSYTTWKAAFTDLHYLNKDGENNDVRLLISLANLVIKKGLSFTNDRDAYLETVRLLAALYGQTNEYEKVINELQLLMDLQERAPSWVYHDFIDAEIHTSDLKRILKNPVNFLQDLARTEDDEEVRAKIAAKQRNILRELFRIGAAYKVSNSHCEVDNTSLDLAAAEYSVKDSIEYKVFVKTLAGGNPEKLFQEEEKNNYSLLLDQKNREKEELLQHEAEIEKQKASLTRKNDELQKSVERLTKLHQEDDKKNSNIIDMARELNQLREENNRLKEENSRPRTEKLEPYVALAKFLHRTIKILCAWLKDSLPDLNNNQNWESFIVSCLKPETLESVHHIEDLDLSTLLYLSLYNKSYLVKSGFIDYADFDYFRSMIEVRNRFAHFNFYENNEQYVNDLRIVKQFLLIIDAKFEIRREIDLYL